jgi:CRP/FNR family cyclic AMP-dependent transcriptional regulator
MKEEIKYIYLKSQPLFFNLEEKELKCLADITRVKTLARGERVNNGEGDLSKLYFIVKGKIKITELNELDEELVKDILTEGDFFGDLGLEGNETDEVAEALTSNTTVCFFNVGNFRKILQSNPMMTMSYASKVSGKLKKLESRHADLVFRDAKARLIRFMKNWARTDGNKMGDKIVLHNYLTHSDIAGFISTSRQSVNVLFNELRDSGLIHYDRKRIELNNPMVWN